MASAAHKIDAEQLDQIAHQMQLRYAENLAQFAIHLPHIYQQIKDIKIENTVLDIGDHGLVMLNHRESVYPKDPLEYAKHQVNQFIKAPQAYTISLEPPAMANSTVQNAHIDRIYQLSGHQGAIKTYISDRQNFPIILCFGVACGFHLELMLEKIDVRHLIIYEGDVEFFLSSFYCIDWQQIFDYFSIGHRRIDLFIGTNVQAHIEETITTVQNNSLPFSSFFYMIQHLEGSFYSELIRQIRERLIVSVQGFGFYDDERQGLLRTMNNMLHKFPFYVRPIADKKQLPIFVVGAGPSLENDIDFIREMQPKVIIMSCGSAIGALLKRGITPDFHVEKERIDAVGNSLRFLKQTRELKKVHLIISNVVIDDIAELFASCSVILKAADFPAALFPTDAFQLNHGQPTAANFGTAVAVALGFKSIALLGVDMGMKDKQKHHISGTVHDAMQDKPEWRAQNQVDMVVDGNLDGKVHTNHLFQWGIFTVSRLAKVHSKGRFYNFSDGAVIPNTETANKATFKKRCTQKKAPDKAVVIADTLACFTEIGFNSERLLAALKVAYAELKSAINHILTLNDYPLNGKKDVINRCDDIMFASLKKEYYFATQHLLGTIIRTPLLYTYSLMSTKKTEHEALIVANKGFDELSKLLKFVVKDLEEIIEEFEARITTERLH